MIPFRSLQMKLVVTFFLMVMLSVSLIGFMTSLEYQRKLLKENEIRARDVADDIRTDSDLMQAIIDENRNDILEILSTETVNLDLYYTTIYNKERVLNVNGIDITASEYGLDPTQITLLDEGLARDIEYQERHILDVILPINEIVGMSLTKDDSDLLFDDFDEIDLFFGSEDEEESEVLFDESESEADAPKSDPEEKEPESTIDLTNVATEKKLIGYIQIGYSLTDYDEEIAANRKFTLYASLAVALIGALVGFVMAMWISAPLKLLTKATEEIAEGNLDHQISVIRRDQIGDLARAFNEMTFELKTIRNVMEELNLAGSLNRIADVIVKFTTEVLEFDRVSLFINQNGLLTSIITSGNWSHGKTTHIEIPTDYCRAKYPSMETTSILYSVVENKVPHKIEEGKEYQISEDRRLFGAPAVFLPLIVNDQVEGLLIASNAQTGKVIGPRSFRLISALAHHTGIAIVNAQLNEKMIDRERLRSQMEVAMHIQTSLLPPDPIIHGYDIAASMLPADRVGGDYYDFIEDTRGQEWIMIGDVTGHGVNSGLIMMMAQTSLQTIIRSMPEMSPRNAIRHLNRILYANVRQRLNKTESMTLLIMQHSQNGTFHFSGKHEYILIYRYATGQCEKIETKGLWVGFVEDMDEDERFVEESSFQLLPNDVCLLYTDGVTEAMNQQKELYELERLERILSAHVNKTASEIRTAIINDIFQWMDKQFDDITFIVMKKLGEGKYEKSAG